MSAGSLDLARYRFRGEVAGRRAAEPDFVTGCGGTLCLVMPPEILMIADEQARCDAARLAGAAYVEGYRAGIAVATKEAA